MSLGRIFGLSVPPSIGAAAAQGAVEGKIRCGAGAGLGAGESSHTGPEIDGLSGGVMDIGKVYDSIAKTYDGEYSDAKSLAENRLLSLMLRNGGLIQGSVLDVGCGTGFLLDIAHTHVPGYLGVDPSQGMVEIAREKHPLNNFAVASAEDLSSIEDESFDSVVSLFGPLNYSQDLPKSLSETFRALKPGGKFMHMFYAKRRSGKTYILGGSQDVEVSYYDKDELVAAFSEESLDIEFFDVFGMTGLLEAFRGRSSRLESMATVVGWLESYVFGKALPNSFQYLMVVGIKDLTHAKT